MAGYSVDPKKCTRRPRLDVRWIGPSPKSGQSVQGVDDHTDYIGIELLDFPISLNVLYIYGYLHIARSCYTLI